MLQTRPPVVVILGHVDHGKTSLLDKIRTSNVVSKEAGGITQHIGAYQVEIGDKEKSKITFIDTPGHAAFSQMRSRGAKVADIAILVVAATDGVMPQTKEAIEIISQLKLPVVVAATKIDLDEATIDKVKGQLSENGIISEDYGGDVPVVGVSSKTGQGVKDLLELIGLVNELHSAMADEQGELEAVVIESRMDKNRGPIASLVVKNGVLQAGESVFSDQIKGKVRNMTDENGLDVKRAGPGKPVEMLGFEAVVPIGSIVTTKPGGDGTEIKKITVVKNKAETLQIILKADVIGSLEAIEKSLPKDTVTVIGSATGEISESDVLEAVAHKAVVVGFNVKVSGSVSKLAETEGVRVKVYPIIYELLEDLEKEVDKKLHPEKAEQQLGSAKIIAIFEINGERVAGAKVEKGKISQGAMMHIKRGDDTLASGKVKSLRKGKEAVSEVKLGEEFGAILAPAIDFEVGDVLVCYVRPA